MAFARFLVCNITTGDERSYATEAEARFALRVAYPDGWINLRDSWAVVRELDAERLELDRGVGPLSRDATGL